MPIDTLYLLGGQQRANADWMQEWHHYQRAMVLRVEPETGQVTVAADHVSPPEACPDDRPSVIFKSGSLAGGRLYACTQTEVLIYRLPEVEPCGYLSLPAFNDLHHVRPTPAGLLVTVTGLDLVQELTLEGQLLREWSVLGGDPWEHFNPTRDYRKVPTTKPHRSHPNFTFLTGDDVWVTRFEQRDALCLTDPGPVEARRRIAIDYERPHDGCLYGGKVYFTTVDGRVLIADPATAAVERMVDLNEIDGGDEALGWCRGLQVVDEDRVLVGFSRLRPSRFRQNLRWIRDRFRRIAVGNRPTRIALYDLAERRLLWQQDLEPAGFNAVFSIHADPGDGGGAG